MVSEINKRSFSIVSNIYCTTLNPNHVTCKQLKGNHLVNTLINKLLKGNLYKKSNLQTQTTNRRRQGAITKVRRKRKMLS